MWGHLHRSNGSSIHINSRVLVVVSMETELESSRDRLLLTKSHCMVTHMGLVTTRNRISSAVIDISNINRFSRTASRDTNRGHIIRNTTVNV